MVVPRMNGCALVKEVPKDAGKIVSMCEHQGVIYIASEYGIFYLVGGKRKNRLQRCKFIKEGK